MLEREAIYQRVWGYAMAHGDRSVDVFIRKLRQKLEKRSPGWGYIHTHFGVGYRFDPEPVGGSRRRAGPAEVAMRPSGPVPPIFTSRSQQLHGRVTAAAPRRHARRHGDGTGHSSQQLEVAWRSGPRSTRRWSTAGR